MDKDKIRRATLVLIDNGVEEDEAETVLQAIGYTLLDRELFPEERPETFDMALIEKTLDEGLTREDITELSDRIGDTQVIPIKIQSEYSAAMGFISQKAMERMRCDLWEITECVKLILESMTPDDNDNRYEYRHSDGNVFRFWLER